MLSTAGLERVPQDARGAAAEHGLRAGDDRGAQGARRRSSTAATASTSARPTRRADRRRAAPRRRRGGDRDRPRRRRPARPRTPPARFRDALGTLEQLVTYGGTTIALDDVLAVLGVADADLLFGAVDAVAAARPARGAARVARLAESGPRRQASSCATSRPTRASCWSSRRSARCRRARGHPRARRAPGRRRPRASPPADVVRLLDLLAAAMRAIEGRRRAAHPARARAGQGRAAREVDPSTQALLPASSGSSRRWRGERQGRTRPAVRAAAAAGRARRSRAPRRRRRPRGAARPAGRARRRRPEPPSRRRSSSAAVRELWPAVVDAGRGDDNVLAVLPRRGAARSTAPSGELVDRLPRRRHVQRSARPSRARDAPGRRRGAAQPRPGVAPQMSVEAARARRGRAGAPARLAEDELIERLKAEFDAEEILDDPDRGRRSLMPQPPT